MRTPRRWSTIRRVRLFAIPFLTAALAACGNGNNSSAGAGGPSDAGSDDDGAVTLSPSGDPPACSTPGEPSTNPPALGNVAGVLDATGTRFVATGGDKAVPVCGPPPTHQFIGDTYVLDVGCAAWTKVASSGPSPRGRQAMALDPTANRAVLFGGRFSSGGETYTTYADVWTFDFATSTWSQAQTSGTAPSGRANSTAVVDAAANRLVVFGGNTSTDGTTLTPQNDTWALDLGTGAWTRIAQGGTVPPARQFHAMAIDPGARVAYVFAGGDANAFIGPFLQDVWALDLAGETWTQVSTTGTGPGGRIEGALVFDTVTKQLVAFAGHDDGTIGNENDLFTLDVSSSPATWTKLPHGDTPGSPATGQCSFPPNFTSVDKQSPERRSAFAYAPRIDGHSFVVFAGDADCGLLADSWWWSNGSGQWTNTQPSPVGQSCLRIETSCKGLCG
jgi:hypothetical protein